MRPRAGRTSRSTGSLLKRRKTVFDDERGLLIDDPDHSDEEDRFILLGMSASLRALVVCHCYRSKDEVVRIISARKANGRERVIYARGGEP
jgi:uncharacterized DUF497 family protein